MDKFPQVNNCRIAIIGMGYVGLPLAVLFANKKKCIITNEQKDHHIIGFDINLSRLEELKKYHDRTNEVDSIRLKKADNLFFTNEIEHLFNAEVFIVTVPTPINNLNNPDLRAIKSATKTVAIALKNKTYNNTPVIIYESTVYPGMIEEVCVPILESDSGLKFNFDFYCGYSPERINPGDKEHTIENIVKITSGSSNKCASFVDRLYASVINAGTYKANSIKIAESAKVIENIQRDLNVALVNELAIIFRKLKINIYEVLEAAGTKWNFLKFKPGLVGGHCIGVDPYYLTFKSESCGYTPEVILAGRRLNNQMGSWIVKEVLKEMIINKFNIGLSKVLIMGFTFKENCPDIRNTKVIDIANGLNEYSINYDIFDPLANKEEAIKEYNIVLLDNIEDFSVYDAIIITVKHDAFYNYDWDSISKLNIILFDIKGFLSKDIEAIRL